MLIRSLEKKEQEWVNEHKLKKAIYAYIVKCINDKDTDELNKDFQHFLKLSETSKIYKDTRGFIYVKDSNHIYFVYHPIYKEPEVFSYDGIKKKGRKQRPWKFWNYICKNKVFPPTEDDYEGFPVFQELTKDMFFYIMRYCSIKDIYRSRLVCKKWLELTKCEHIWRRCITLLEIPNNNVFTREFFEKSVLCGDSKESMMIIAKMWLFKNMNLGKKPSDLVYEEMKQYSFSQSMGDNKRSKSYRLDHLYGMHLNDYLKPGRRDRSWLYIKKMVYITYGERGVGWRNELKKYPIVWF
jgi:hypothetical protein